jgi:hypothetical protein
MKWRGRVASDPPGRVTTSDQPPADAPGRSLVAVKLASAVRLLGADSTPWNRVSGPMVEKSPWIRRLLIEAEAPEHSAPLLDEPSK